MVTNADLVVVETHLGSSAHNGNHLCIQVRRVTRDDEPGFDVRTYVNHRITSGPKWKRGIRSYPSWLGYFIRSEEQARTVANVMWREAKTVGPEAPMAKAALAAGHREARRLGLERRWEG